MLAALDQRIAWDGTRWMAGYFITIEGIEGAGKTTLARRIQAWLAPQGVAVCLTREPGGTETGERLRDLLLHSDLPLCPETELFIIESARAQLMDEVILPALESDQLVLLDRHTDSTLAYQGFGRGLERTAIEAANRLATRGRTPDSTIVLDIDPQTGLERAQQKAHQFPAPDRFERETYDFLSRVREGFLTLARENADRMLVLPGSKSEEELWEETKRALAGRTCLQTWISRAG